MLLTLTTLSVATASLTLLVSLLAMQNLGPTPTPADLLNRNLHLIKCPGDSSSSAAGILGDYHDTATVKTPGLNVVLLT